MIKVITRVERLGAKFNPITEEVNSTRVRVYVDVSDGGVVLASVLVFNGTVREAAGFGVKFGGHPEEGVRL